MMGVVLSLIVVAIGVIEALSCYHHFQIGVLRWDPNTHDNTRRRSLFTSFRRKKKKAVVYAPAVSEEPLQWSPEDRRRLQRVAKSLELHLLQLQQQHLQLQLQIVKLQDKQVDGYSGTKPRPIRSISVPEKQTPRDATNLVDEFNEIYEKTISELRQQKQLIEKRPSITDIAVNLENAALSEPIKIDTFADEIVEIETDEKFASAGLLFTKPLVQLDSETDNINYQVDSEKVENHSLADENPSPESRAKRDNTSNVPSGVADSGISNHSAKTQIASHPSESDVHVFNYVHFDGCQEAVKLKETEIIPSGTRCDSKEIDLEDKLILNSGNFSSSLNVDIPEQKKAADNSVSNDHRLLGDKVLLVTHSDVLSPVVVSDVPIAVDAYHNEPQLVNDYEEQDKQIVLRVEGSVEITKPLGEDFKIIRGINDVEIDKCFPVDELESAGSLAFNGGVTDSSAGSNKEPSSVDWEIGADARNVPETPTNCSSYEHSATEMEGSTKEPFWLIFSGEYTKAMSKDWHSGHFSCWQCDEPLTGQRYVLRDDHPYCIKCYEQVFANACEECSKTIGIDSKDLSYKDKHWHEACFLCNKCRVSLVDKQFGSKADKIYCGNCYDAQFASRCDGCGEIFRAGTKKMEYKTRQWHEKCFCCCVCKTAIGTKSFIPREQEIYCSTCYEEKFATRCVKCNKIITSGGVTYKNEPWHRDCFTCTNCNTSLAGQRFTSRDEKPYCADCFGELFAKRCTSCSRPITGIGGTRFISFEDRHWHNDCFICAQCKTSLVGRGFITDEDDIICPECAKQRLM